MKIVLLTTIFILFIVLVALAESDSTRQHIKIYPRVETYASGTVYFNDSLGNTMSRFNTEVVVEMFAKQDYVHLNISGAQAYYYISEYKTIMFKGVLMREWFVIDENVALIILDEELNIYFIRYDGQMMVVPECTPR
jgi:hypothetical protein